MNVLKEQEQRSEQRLCYDWPIRFAEDFDGILSQGNMVDICSRGGAFTCRADRHCPSPGQEVTALFSVPRFGRKGSYDMANYARVGRICRVEEVDESVRRVAMQFIEPLFFKPGEQGISEADVELRLQAVVV